MPGGNWGRADAGAASVTAWHAFEYRDAQIFGAREISCYPISGAQKDVHLVKLQLQHKFAAGNRLGDQLGRFVVAKLWIWFAMPENLSLSNPITASKLSPVPDLTSSSPRSPRDSKVIN